MMMMQMQKRQHAVELSSERGNAMLETLPLLAIFMMFMAFAMGLFGVVHTGILYSIGARTYAFETFRYRTNLTYHRENLKGVLETPYTMKPFEGRFHIVQTDTPSSDTHLQATLRPIAIGTKVQKTPGTPQDHNSKIFNLQVRNQNLSVSPVWIMVGYGMCLNAHCGGSDTSTGGPIP